HLRRRAARAQGRADRGAVREAAQRADRAGARRRDPRLPRPHGPRRRADRRRARARPGADAAGLPVLGLGAQPRARVHEGRLRRPDAGARLEPELRRELAAGAPLRAARLRDRAGARVHGRLRHRPRGDAAAPPGRRLDEPRGAPARVRGGADAARLAHGRLVRLLGPHALAREPHARARRRARRVLRRRAQPARGQGRAGGDRRGGRRAVRPAQPRPRAGPADPDRPARCRGGRRAAAAAPARGARGEAPGRVGLRPDARERLRRERAQDAPLRRDHGRARGLLRRVPRGARVARRRPPRVHRRGRDRVPGRVGGPRRGAPRPPLRDALRPAPERAPVARPGLPPGRAHAALVVGRVAIVGTGLIGASVGLAARRAGAAVAGWDPDPAALAAAEARGALDEAAGTLESALAGAELAVVAAPIAALAGVVAAVLEATGEETTVTDVGSTKASVVAAAGGSPRFVGGHPICGSEARGAEHASAGIFEGATWFLTPTAQTDNERHRLVHGFAGSLGAFPVAIDPAAHDRLVAMTSHLPHVLANVVVNQAGAVRVEGHEPLANAGGSLRDMTRIAGANPRIWTDIFLDNAGALRDALAEHRRRVEEVEAALAEGDAGFLARFIGEASQNRRRM